MTAAEGAALESHEDVEKYKVDKAVQWLADCIPINCYPSIWGHRGMQQVPNVSERRAALESVIRSKAGSDGGRLDKARRALGSLLIFRPTDTFPASALLDLPDQTCWEYGISSEMGRNSNLYVGKGGHTRRNGGATRAETRNGQS